LAVSGWTGQGKGEQIVVFFLSLSEVLSTHNKIPRSTGILELKIETDFSLDRLQ
jgi:hypothetical protein